MMEPEHGSAPRPPRPRVLTITMLWFLAALVLVMVPALQSQSQEMPGRTVEEPTEPIQENPVLPPEAEGLAQRIFAELISPCCWTTTVAQHGSGAAPRIQAEVRRMLAGGMGYTEIMDQYVRQYGERILAKPEKRGFNLAVYLVPYAAIAAGAVLVVMVFRRRGARSQYRAAPGGEDRVAATAAPGAGGAAGRPIPGTEEDYRRRLDEELRRTV